MKKANKDIVKKRIKMKIKEWRKIAIIPFILDKVTLRVLKKFVCKGAKEYYQGKKEYVSYTESGVYAFIHFHDDIFNDYEYRNYTIVSNILRVLYELEYTEQPYFNIEMNQEVFNETNQDFFYEIFSLYEIELAFDFPEKLFLFDINPFKSSFIPKLFKNEGFTYYSSSKGKNSNRSTVAIYDRSKSTDDGGNTIRFEFRMRRDEYLGHFVLQDLDIKIKRLAVMAKPLLIEITEKYLRDENFNLKDASLFRTLHPYLYSVLVKGGCGARNSQNILEELVMS